MILIINICSQQLHYFEFVKPIEDILARLETPYITRHYSKVSKADLSMCHRIIITGTSLQDFGYTAHLKKFDFLKFFDKPVLAICGGMQLLCMIHGCKLEKFQEIGLRSITFNAPFLGIDAAGKNGNGTREVYCLHNMAIANDDILKGSFHIYSSTGCIQAVGHKHYKHYGVLFHPEVRNKDLIENFLYA